MTWTVDSSGTTTLTGSGTEDILVSGATTNATYVFKADIANMANGDIVEIRVYTKVLTGDTLRVAWKSTFANIPTTKIVISPPVASDFSCKISMTQQAGTGRSVTWSLLRI